MSVKNPFSFLHFLKQTYRITRNYIINPRKNDRFSYIVLINVIETILLHDIDDIVIGHPFVVVQYMFSKII